MAASISAAGECSLRSVRSVRACSRSGCLQPAVATLTYDYSDSTAVLGPLATAAEPHAYDLCEGHAQSLSAPRGWQVVRLATTFVAAEPTEDDLMALANAVREATRAPAQPRRPAQPEPATGRRSAPPPKTRA